MKLRVHHNRPNPCQVTMAALAPAPVPRDLMDKTQLLTKVTITAGIRTKMEVTTAEIVTAAASITRRRSSPPLHNNLAEAEAVTTECATRAVMAVLKVAIALVEAAKAGPLPDSRKEAALVIIQITGEEPKRIR